MQPRAPAAIHVWLRQAKSCPSPSDRGHFDDFGCHKNRSRPFRVGVGALSITQPRFLPITRPLAGLTASPKNGRFRHGLLKRDTSSSRSEAPASSPAAAEPVRRPPPAPVSD